MMSRLKLFGFTFACVAGGLGGAFILLWLMIGFINMGLFQLDWVIARIIVAVAFLAAFFIAILEGGEGA